MPCGTQERPTPLSISTTGLSPSLAVLSRTVRLSNRGSRYGRPTTPSHRSETVWPVPRSLAATWEISVDFSSSGYLDVSIPRVSLVRLCIYRTMTPHDRGRVSPFGNLRIDACIAAPRSLSQPSNVLHRLLVPRHPPCALSSLTSTYSSPGLSSGGRWSSR